jgi:aminoglycoside 3-N-acetyltransferase
MLCLQPATLIEFFKTLGVRPRQHLIVHSSFRKIHNEFAQITISDLIETLKTLITPSGSIVMPTFTYCFKHSSGEFTIFNQSSSPSRVGAVTEVFRHSERVVRTASPTHSFGLWGEIVHQIDRYNNPPSPLGEGSVIEWLVNRPNSYVLMLGVDFSTLTLGHYIEIKAGVPWSDYSPWGYLNVLPIGISTRNEIQLKEVPGCAKAFTNFEYYLLQKNLITKYQYGALATYFISIPLIYNAGLSYFRNNSKDLLCPVTCCPACDARRKKFSEIFFNNS